MARMAGINLGFVLIFSVFLILSSTLASPTMTNTSISVTNVTTTTFPSVDTSTNIGQDNHSSTTTTLSGKNETETSSQLPEVSGTVDEPIQNADLKDLLPVNKNSSISQLKSFAQMITSKLPTVEALIQNFEEKARWNIMGHLKQAINAIKCSIGNCIPDSTSKTELLDSTDLKNFKISLKGKDEPLITTTTTVVTPPMVLN